MREGKEGRKVEKRGDERGKGRERREGPRLVSVWALRMVTQALN